MKVVFLDLSGVMTCFRHDENPGDEFCREAVMRLDYLCLRCGAEIVISSDWVQHEPEKSFPEVKALLASHGLCAKVQGYTVQAFDDTFLDRPKRILAYLDAHPEIDGFVIFDDMPLPVGAEARAQIHGTKLPPDDPFLGDRFVWISDGRGLTRRRVEEAIHKISMPLVTQ